MVMCCDCAMPTHSSPCKSQHITGSRRLTSLTEETDQLVTLCCLLTVKQGQKVKTDRDPPINGIHDRPAIADVV